MPKTTIHITDEQYVQLTDLQKEKDFASLKATLDYVFNGFIKGESYQSMPLKCEGCPKFGGLIPKGVICITKKTIDSKMQYQVIPLNVACVCAEKSFNTPINKKTREQYEIDIRTLNHSHNIEAHKYLRVIKQQEKKLESFKRPMQDLITEKNALKSRVSTMQNILLARDQKIATLETDNQQLRQMTEKLKENRLFEENQLLKAQIGQKNIQISDYIIELEKLEALAKVQREQRNDIIMKVSKMLRDFKQFAPSISHPLTGYESMQYLRSIQKAVENLEGYLNTVGS